LAAIAIIPLVLIFTLPQPSASVSFVGKSGISEFQLSHPSNRKAPDPEIQSIDAFLKKSEVSEVNRRRLAVSIVASARKFNLDPKLIASITIVESRGNPFAISGKSAVGIMQIHLPTWGQTADREGLNLFRIEDNIEFGSRILRDYTLQYGVWEGVRRYSGFIRGNVESEQSADDYEAKVQQTYGIGLAPKS
jgi:soluble lytic murein transglycosylase-like protein